MSAFYKGERLWMNVCFVFRCRSMRERLWSVLTVQLKHRAADGLCTCIYSYEEGYHRKFKCAVNKLNHKQKQARDTNVIYTKVPKKGSYGYDTTTGEETY